MKKVSFLFLMLACVMLNSCNYFEFDNSHPYDQFSGSDHDYLLDAYEQEGKITKFINQNNEIIEIQNVYHHTFKEFDNALFPTVSNSRYYDELWIQLLLLDANTTCQFLDIRITKTSNGELFHRVTVPRYDGGSCTGTIFQFSTPEVTEYPKTQMTINNTTYEEVLVEGKGI